VIPKQTAPAHILAQGAANAANAWHTTAGTVKFRAASFPRLARKHMTGPSKTFTGTTKRTADFFESG
jgi:hypothetical protein